MVHFNGSIYTEKAHLAISHKHTGAKSGITETSLGKQFSKKIFKPKL